MLVKWDYTSAGYWETKLDSLRLAISVNQEGRFNAYRDSVLVYKNAGSFEEAKAQVICSSKQVLEDRIKFLQEVIASAESTNF